MKEDVYEVSIAENLPWWIYRNEGSAEKVSR